MAAKSAAERLADALREAGLHDLVERAEAGYYGDFTSPLAMPAIQLVLDLQARGAVILARRAMHGAFDGE
jgi:hypothetical protein